MAFSPFATSGVSPGMGECLLRHQAAEIGRSNLIVLRVNGEVSRQGFEEARTVFSDKIDETEERIERLASSQATADSFVRFAELQLTDMAHAGPS
jgi:hypothetical protein